MAAGSALILAIGQSPARVWGALLARTLGDAGGVAQVLFKATPLLFTGLAVAIALRAGLFNIGVEGQLVAGLLACGVVGGALPAATPGLIAVPLCLLAAATAGGALGAATGALRAWRGSHEVIVGILLNAIVGAVVLWLGDAYLFVGESTRTADVVDGARLATIGPAGTALNTAAPLALAAAAAIAWLFARTRTGARWRAVGAAPDAAACAGGGVRRSMLTAMTLSGAIAGLAAAHYVLGYKYCYEDGVGRGAGFLGIAVALLGRGHPGGVVAAALLLGLLSHGGLVVSDLVPKELFDVLTAVIILAVAASTPMVRRRGLAALTRGARRAGLSGVAADGGAP
ncbi:MAG: ABC transporter permease [Kofleriaceae bacterium]|nr:ABC transporter permease [Kofleriaceae bacterium]